MNIKEKIKRLKEEIQTVGGIKAYNNICSYIVNNKLFDRIINIEDIKDDNVRSDAKSLGIKKCYFVKSEKILVVFGEGNTYIFLYECSNNKGYAISPNIINVIKKYS